MVSPIPDDNAPSSILEIIQMQRKNLSRPQTSMQHQQEHRFVPSAGKRIEEFANLVIIHWAWKALHRFHTHCSSDGALATRPAHKWSMSFRNTCQSRIIDFLDGI